MTDKVKNDDLTNISINFANKNSIIKQYNHEFVPKQEDKIASLEKCIRICDV